MELSWNRRKTSDWGAAGVISNVLIFKRSLTIADRYFSINQFLQYIICGQFQHNKGRGRKLETAVCIVGCFSRVSSDLQWHCLDCYTILARQTPDHIHPWQIQKNRESASKQTAEWHMTHSALLLYQGKPAEPSSCKCTKRSHHILPLSYRQAANIMANANPVYTQQPSLLPQARTPDV